MVLGLTTLFSTITGLLQGFGFGTGYGSGVRFGYEDLYPLLKTQGQRLLELLGLNSFATSGFNAPAQLGGHSTTGLLKPNY